MKLTINIDGGSRGNPGPAAYGCYILGAGNPISLKGRLGVTTNNLAEYHGLLRALEKSKELGANEVDIRADSELLVKQMTGIYKVKNERIAELVAIARQLIREIGTVRFKHVYREDNAIADALCNEALDDPNMPIEPLGLKQEAHQETNYPGKSKSRFCVEKTPVKKLESQSTEVHPSTEADRAKVKLTGSLLMLTTDKTTKKYAVVVNGNSWPLLFARIPSDIKSGDRVQVTGDLLLQNRKPFVKVRKLIKA
ncbi:MAG TPA: ribonuclease HI family protein [Gemmatales bacterium]|nr:ribonuclease HI family protein [Gemmatales bacterium]HMP17909.1 ribonuclease HI family protein [Gemmatales bacterium]